MTSISCEVGLSGLENLGSSFAAPGPATEHQQQCWAGERVTVMGEPNSGVTSVCNVLSGLSSSMGKGSLGSGIFDPLTVRMTFARPGQYQGVFVEICGLGRYHAPRHDRERLLSLFTDWKSAHTANLAQRGGTSPSGANRIVWFDFDLVPLM